MTTGKNSGSQNYVTKSEILDFSEEKNFQCFDWEDYPIDADRFSGGLVGDIAVICGGHESQRAEAILNKISNIISKTYTGLIVCFKDSKNVLHEILAIRAWKG